jgi:hypothetical protein
MGTLAEIEDAVERLPLPEQRKLLSHLQLRLATDTPVRVNREMWLRRLGELRARTKPVGQSIQQVVDAIRAEPL